jgi:hypothetical protein
MSFRSKHMMREMTDGRAIPTLRNLPFMDGKPECIPIQDWGQLLFQGLFQQLGNASGLTLRAI